MRIILWHGYLLGGSGSNVYSANLIRVWRDQGHDVLLLCQERDRSFMGAVDEEGDFDPGNRSLSTRPSGIPTSRGTCVLVRPDIHGLLPVYVYDEYPGFRAKRFVDLDVHELDDYVESNVAALRTAIERHEPDAVIVGHEVMGPHIAHLAMDGLSPGYLAKLHGSALEYAVKPQERYQRYAASGLNGARRVAGGSDYMVREALSVVPGWRDKAVVVNPGCDTDLFKPLPERAVTTPKVGFVGKLMASKGVQDLLAGLPFTATRPLDVTIVGFGDLSTKLQAMWSAMSTRDARALTEELVDLPLSDNARSALLGAAERVRSLAGVSVTFTGRLDHDALAPLLPDFDLLVAPSILPEAFGMVAAEAAAAGVLPILPGHSGIGEVGRRLEDHLDLHGRLVFDPGDPVLGIARRIDDLLSIPTEERRELGRSAADLAGQIWSWEHVADALLGAAV